MAGQRTSGRSPSLLLRLLLGAGLALALALALVGLAVDRAFQGAAEAAMKERLEAVVYLILSTLELDAEKRPVVPDDLAEPRLVQPGSGLHGGAMTPAGEWRSPSLVGVTPQPNARLIERGRELFRGADIGTWNVFAIGLGWELPDGEIVDLTIWAAEDPNHLAMTTAGFRADLWRWLGLAGALIVLAQIVILLLLLRPLRRVAGEVREIEAGRRRKLGDDFPRELQPLTANLNALLETERENARQYRRALADLAHALKTPVAVMRARLEEEERGGGAELVRSLTDMERMIRRQLERAARSTRITLPEAVAVRPIVERLADSIRRIHAGGGLAVEVIGDSGLEVQIDERDLWEICGNLMENAAKYGDGRIRVTIEPGAPGERRRGVSIRVEDNGPGMDEERFEQLLQRGARGDELREGQGLGLPIVQQLVDARGGRLECARSGLGGAAIRVILPPR